MRDVTLGVRYPFSCAGSERRLARISRISRGALSHIGKRSLPLRLRAPTCLELPTHGALSQYGLVGTAPPPDSLESYILNSELPDSLAPLVAPLV